MPLIVCVYIYSYVHTLNYPKMSQAEAEPNYLVTKN